jgi:putative DNA primase/helicase
VESQYHAESAAKPPNRSFSSNFSEIPEVLRSRPRWMGTRFVVRKDGKKDKPPYRVVSGLPVIKADKTNRDNWATYSEALAAYTSGQVDAIGYVFTDDDPDFVADLDGVVDRDTGEIHPAAAEVIHALGSYTEISCSGTGVHVIGHGAKPEYAGCRSNKLGFDMEIYDSARFMVMTGQRMTDVLGPKDRQDELLSLCRKLWAKRERLYSKRTTHPAPVGLEDQELLERARHSRTGAKFRRLYDAGDTTGYASASEADFSLLNMLIFWTAGDRNQITRLFEASALHRAKDKHRDYVRRSVDNALGSYIGSIYKPRRVEKAQQEEPATQADPLTPYLELLLDPSLWGGRKGASAYKLFTAAVIRATEHGVVDDEDNMRIGCDTRTLAELAGMGRNTLRESALPYLVQEMKLLTWRSGKGKQAGTFVLINPARNNVTRPNKVSTHSIGSSYVNAKQALETLRLLIRMRRGRDKNTKLARLGMPAMFVTVALAASLRCGQNTTELAQRTGRRKYDLRDVLKRLKAAGIVREVSEDVYRLTDDFQAQYERELQQSGIARVERVQRRQHELDRARRDEKIPVDKQPTPLRGRDQVRRIMERKRKEAGNQGTEKRQTDEQRIRVLIAQGMKPSWARTEVLGGEVAVEAGGMTKDPYRKETQ